MTSEFEHNVFVGLRLAAAGASPMIEMILKGTSHEDHDWCVHGRGPVRFACSCGMPLDDMLGLPALTAWFLAVCAPCEVSVPFGREMAAARDEWADEHESSTGHPVLRTAEWR